MERKFGNGKINKETKKERKECSESKVRAYIEKMCGSERNGREIIMIEKKERIKHKKLAF